MTVVNILGRPEQDLQADRPRSTWFSGRPRPDSFKFWLTGIAFLALYLGLNKLTATHGLDGLGITLWSPDNGLSFVMVIEGAMYAPFVFLAAVLTDIFIVGVQHNLYVTVAAELVLTVCYVGLGIQPETGPACEHQAHRPPVGDQREDG